MPAESEVIQSYKTRDALRHALAKRIGTGPLKLPMMPQVASKIMALTNDPNADLAKISDLIHRDPALAGRVLHTANSALYGGSEPLVSLPDAIGRLGMQTLSEITLAASLQAGIFRVPGFEQEVLHLWRHALASGIYAKEIARLVHAHLEAMFLCGLLHAIGKPVLLQLIANVQRESNVQLRPDSVQSVIEEFQSDLGRKVLQQWTLPEQVQMGCAYYRNYADAPSCGAEAAMTYLSDQLATWAIVPSDDLEQTLRQDPVLSTLQIPPDDLQVLFDKREAVLSTVQAMDR